MRSDRVHIDSPCHESWDAMEGDGARRFCGVCSRHVHDLSAMNLDDADELLRASAGQELCVRYQTEADGSVRFRDLVPRSRLTRGLVRTAFAASIFAACMPQERVPVVDVGQAAIASLIDTSTSPGGCDVSPTPAVTFHLPPGHFLCALTGDDATTDLPPALLAAPPPALAPPPAYVPPPAIAAPAYAPPPRIASASPPPVASAPPPTHFQPYAPGFAPPPPPVRAHDVPPRHFAPPPPAPQPFPGHGFAPPPDPFPGTDPTPIVTPPPPPPPRPEPLMGSISVPEPSTMMGRRSPSTR